MSRHATSKSEVAFHAESSLLREQKIAQEVKKMWGPHEVSSIPVRRSATASQILSCQQACALCKIFSLDVETDHEVRSRDLVLLTNFCERGTSNETSVLILCGHLGDVRTLHLSTSHLSAKFKTPLLYRPSVTVHHIFPTQILVLNIAYWRALAVLSSKISSKCICIPSRLPVYLHPDYEKAHSN